MSAYIDRINLRKNFVQRLFKIDLTENIRITPTEDYHGFALWGDHELRMIYFLDDSALFLDNTGFPKIYQIPYEVFLNRTCDKRSSEGRQLPTLYEYIEGIFSFLNTH